MLQLLWRTGALDGLAKTGDVVLSAAPAFLSPYGKVVLAVTTYEQSPARCSETAEKSSVIANATASRAHDVTADNPASSAPFSRSADRHREEKQ